MPIELKRPISDITGLTCENCIHYQSDLSDNIVCINPDSYEWDRLSGDTCSLGQWFKTAHYDDGDGINLFNFSTMMLLFAEEKLDATVNNT